MTVCDLQLWHGFPDLKTATALRNRQRRAGCRERRRERTPAPSLPRPCLTPASSLAHLFCPSQVSGDAGAWLRVHADPRLPAEPQPLLTPCIILVLMSLGQWQCWSMGSSTC